MYQCRFFAKFSLIFFGCNLFYTYLQLKFRWCTLLTRIQLLIWLPSQTSGFVFRAQNFSHLNRKKEFGTVESPSHTQAQESRDSTRDWSKSIVLSRLSCTCLGEGESTVLNSFVRLRGRKFSAQMPEIQSPIHSYGWYIWSKSLVLSRLSCTCVGERESTVPNSLVRLRWLKFWALRPELWLFDHT
jgi:hypothetical protein